MRNGFSFVEVLVSIMILALLGTALIKFNSFNKRVMEKNISSQENLLLSSAFMFLQEIENDKEIELYELVKFDKLDDEDMKFLKSIKLKATKEIEDEIFLPSMDEGGDGESLEFGEFSITYKDNTQKYLWVEKEK